MHEELIHAAIKVIRERFHVEDATCSFETPREARFGDLTSQVAMALGKKLHVNPREIAEAIAVALSKLSIVEKAEGVAPGFVNVWLTPEALLLKLQETRTACTAKVKRQGEAPVIVEYSQPNIAKPLGAHHLLSTLIGQAIANLYLHQGYPTVRWNYLGDWGTQFGKLAVAMEMWGGGKSARQMSIDDFLELYVRFHKEAEKVPALEDKAREVFAALERGDPDLRAFREDIVWVTKKELLRLYERLHVSFDLDLGEAFYEDKMSPVLEEGKAKGVFREGEKGALIVEFPAEENLPPYMVLKGDGATLYSTRDLAQMRYRMETYHPQEILIVTDIAQRLHFLQLIATCEQLGWTLPPFENVLVGRMRFRDRAMSTRKGNVLRLEEVLTEAVRRAEAVIEEHAEEAKSTDRPALAEMMGVGAVAYGILSQNRKQDIAFDWDKMLSFDGNSAPYLQYTHARARSVLRKSGVAGNPEAPASVGTLSDRERSLIRTLLKFARILEEARSAHMPHILANYLYELCQDYNAFYNTEPILKAPEPSRTLRLSLTATTAGVIKTGAELLTIRVPDSM